MDSSIILRLCCLFSRRILCHVGTLLETDVFRTPSGNNSAKLLKLKEVVVNFLSRLLIRKMIHLLDVSQVDC